jgi:aminoglycoside phosphotransferase (APT) family kinase protein
MGEPSGSLLDVDWRFLLPLPPAGSFRKLLLLGGGASVAKRVRATGLAQEVELSPSPGSADAVVCLHGAAVSLRAAASFLAPGGVLCYEHLRRRFPPLHRSLDGLSRSLTGAGLTPHGIYWVHPRFSGLRTYFPLEARHAVRWYARSLSGASSAGAGAASWAARKATRLDPGRLGRFVPRLVVVAVAGDAERSGLPLPRVDLPQDLRRPDLYPLLLVHGDERSRVVMLPFAPDSPEPIAVVKIQRRPPPVDAASRDQQTLGAIRPRLTPELQATIPEPLGAVRGTGFSAAIESFLAGEWLHARWQRSLRLGELVEDLELARDWLTEFHAQSRVELRPWGESEREEWVERPLAAYEETFGVTAAESALFAQTRRIARELLGLPLPIVWQHGDFSSLNVLRSGSTISVLDWESAAPGLPLEDLLYFVTRWLLRARSSATNGKRWSAAAATDPFRQFFLDLDSREPDVGAARAAIAAYVDRLGLDRRFLPVLLVRPWVVRAVGRHERQASAARLEGPARRGTGALTRHADPARPREGNRYVTYVDMLAEQPELLFEFVGEDAGDDPAL